MTDPLCARPEYATTNKSFWVGVDVEPAHLLHEREHKAKQLCAECPEKEPCAQWARDTEQIYGVWGGEGTTDRGFPVPEKIFINRTPVRDYLPGDEQCGTLRGLDKHLQAGEPPCPVCVRWAFAVPVCGEPSGVAEHRRTNSDTKCPKCFPEANNPAAAPSKPELTRADCGTPLGHKWHRHVRRERPCDDCCVFTCGRDSEYAQHRRYGEWIDPACRAAHAAANALRRLNKRNKEDNAPLVAVG